MMSNVPHSQQGIVDLRSDTVSRPTAAMYEAMIAAPLGDDVLGDEPTVSELETLAAQMVGKAAAVFVPSGTMGNQIALACHCDRGDALLIEEEAHILYYECGAPAIIGNVVTWTLPSHNGLMDPATIESHIVKRSLHTPGTTLLCLENTHNRAGGTITPPDLMAEYRRISDQHGLKIHLDGARVFNASVGLGVDVRDITSQVDSVNFCLSKGLGSPVGSLLCGSEDFISKAREWRKRLGGGMRQAGILAACGLVSLRTMVDRLADDHARTRKLGEAIDKVPGLSVDWERVQTNILLIYTEASAEDVIGELKNHGVWALSPGPNRIRCVFHHDIDDGKLDRACAAFEKSAAVLR